MAAIAEKSRREMFDYMDWDKDGKLSVDDFKFAVRAVGIVASEAEIEPFCKDASKAGGIGFDNYSKLIDRYVEKQRVIINEQCQIELLRDLRVAFDRMDKRKKGLVPIDDLKKYLTTLGEKITEKEFDEVFSHRKGKEDQVNFEQFFKIVMGRSTYNLRQ
jgi:Ca2+-binding EF-hand superfamily protein